MTRPANVPGPMMSRLCREHAVSLMGAGDVVTHLHATALADGPEQPTTREQWWAALAARGTAAAPPLVGAWLPNEHGDIEALVLRGIKFTRGINQVDRDCAAPYMVPLHHVATMVQASGLWVWSAFIGQALGCNLPQETARDGRAVCERWVAHRLGRRSAGP